MFVDCFNNKGFLRSRQLRPFNLYVLLSSFLNPYFCNRLSPMRFLTSTSNDVYMPSVFICISRKDR